MVEAVLRDRTVLIAEDEYMIATALERELVRAGAYIIGPAASLERTMDLIDRTDHLDAAILDVNLQGEKVFPAAELLEGRGVPFLFTTGYDQSVIPPRFRDVVRCEKPIGSAHLVRTLLAVLAKERSQPS